MPNQGGGLYQLFLRDGFGGAVGFAVGIVGGADPDRSRGGGFAAVVFAAYGAGDKPREGGWLLWLGGGILLFSPLDLRLDGIESLQRDDGFVGVRSIIPGQFTLVFPGDFGQMVLPKFGLEQEIPGIGIVSENSFHGTLVEHTAALGGVSPFVQPFGDSGNTPSREIVTEDAPDDLRFFRDDSQLTVLPAVAQHEVSPGNAFFEVSFHPPLLVFAGGEAFLLGITCQDGKHQFTVSGGGVDGLFFKINADAQFLQLPYRFQKGHGISGKPGYGLGDDVIDLSGTAVGEHPLEILPAVSGAGLGFVGVNAHILPAVMVADVGAVMIHLGRQGVKHGILAAGHSGVCRHPEGLGHPGCKLDLFYGSWHGILLCIKYRQLHILLVSGDIASPYRDEFQMNILSCFRPVFMARTAFARSWVWISSSPSRQRLSSIAQSIRYRMRSSCVGVTGAGAVFAFPVSIADKLLSAVFAGQMVIGFPLHLLRVGVPPGVPALIGAEVFGLSALHLENELSALAAFDPDSIFQRVAADVGSDSIDGDLKGERDVHGGFATAAHDIQDFDFMLGHIETSCV